MNLHTSPGLLSSLPLGSARSGGERDLTVDCWDCCCFSCCSWFNLFSASVSFCCSCSSWDQCSCLTNSIFSCRQNGNKKKRTGPISHLTILSSEVFIANLSLANLLESQLLFVSVVHFSATTQFFKYDWSTKRTTTKVMGEKPKKAMQGKRARKISCKLEKAKK